MVDRVGLHVHGVGIELMTQILISIHCIPAWVLYQNSPYRVQSVIWITYSVARGPSG